MHDINKELEKFFQLLEEAESSTDSDTGSPTSSMTPARQPDRKPNPLPSTPQPRIESSPTPTVQREQYSLNSQTEHQVAPDNIQPSTEQPRVAPTPIESIPARPIATPTPIVPRSVTPPAHPPVTPPVANYGGRAVSDQGSDRSQPQTAGANSQSEYPSSERETQGESSSQSNLDQLMQEVRGKLNQPARPRTASLGSTLSTSNGDRQHATVEVDAPVAASMSTQTPTWRKGVLTGLAMVLPACLVLAIILNRPEKTLDIDTSGPVVENANALPAEQAELSMTSSPSGARIFLDGELFGVTPFESIRIKPGTYKVTAEVPGFASIDTTLTLRARHWISLNIPNGEEDVFFAGNDSAEDHILAGLPSSDQEVPSETDEANDQQDAVETRRESTPPPRQVSRPRPTTGAIMFTSEPSGAMVFLDNQAQGVTPLSMSKVAGGAHSVTYSLDGYNDYSVGLELTPGIQTPLHGSLSPAFGTVVLNVESSGTVFVDGSLMESDVSGTRTFELEAGSHKIAVQRSGQVPWEMDVDVSSGQSQTIVVEAPDSGFSNAFALAEQHYGSGDFKAARDAFEQAGLLDPTNRLVKGKIAEIDRLIAAERTQELTEAIIENGVYLITDTPPKLVGGLEGLHKRVKYPEAAYQAGVTGRVYIQFVVNEDGKASNFTVTKGLPLGCNEEAIRAIEAAQFEPATFEGRTVKARHTLFVNFDQ